MLPRRLANPLGGRQRGAGVGQDDVWLDSVVSPLGRVRWTNAFVFAIAASAICGAVADLVTGIVHPASLVLAALLAFPLASAWKHPDPVDSMGRLGSIVAVLFFTAVTIAGAVLSLVMAAYAAPYDSLGADLGAQGLILGLAAFCGMLGVAGILTARLRPIDGIGPSVPELSHDLRAAGHASVDVRARPAHPIIGLLLVIAGLVVLTGVHFVPIDWAGAQKFRIGELALAIGSILLFAARGAFQPEARALLAGDPRPPVLLLRSFADDEGQDVFATGGWFLDGTLEARLAGHFRRHGPFITVRPPRRWWPIAGAARTGLSEEEWRDQILHWMREASLILLMAGKSRSVDWELRAAIERGCMDRLIIGFPPIPNRRWIDFGQEMVTRLDLLRAAFAGTPWEEAMGRIDSPETLRALLPQPDGRIIAIRAETRSHDSYQVAILSAHWLLLSRQTDSDDAKKAIAAPDPAPAREFAFAAAIAAGLLLVGDGMAENVPGLRVMGLSALALALVLGPLPLLLRPLRRTWARLPLAAAAALPSVYAFGFAFLPWLNASLAETAAVANDPYSRLPPEDQLRFGIGFVQGGHLLEQDIPLGCRLIGRAAAAGLRAARADATRCLLDGHQIGFDPGRLDAWLAPAAEAGDANAAEMLGTMYLDGRGLRADSGRGLALLDRAAGGGSDRAALRLGLAYLFGDRVARDPVRARGYFRQSAQAGNGFGLFRYAYMLDHGLGGARDRPQAARVYEQAVAEGNFEAMLNLGTMLYNGEGIARDRPRAQSLFVRALRAPEEATRHAASENLRLFARETPAGSAPILPSSG
jgi:TPR repeat protein